MRPKELRFVVQRHLVFGRLLNVQKTVTTKKEGMPSQQTINVTKTFLFGLIENITYKTFFECFHSKIKIVTIQIVL